MTPQPPRWWSGLTLPQRGLLGVCVALALLCAWLLRPTGGVPAALAAAPQPLEPVPAIAPPQATAGLEYDVLVERNLFSRSRSAPADRWRPAGDEAARTAPLPEPAPREAVPPYRLFGTVVARRLEDSFAVIEADPEKPGPELYNVGDRIGPYRLTSIYYTRVVLTGEGTTRELRLVPDTASGAGAASERVRPQRPNSSQRVQP